MMNDPPLDHKRSCMVGDTKVRLVFELCKIKIVGPERYYILAGVWV